MDKEDVLNNGSTIINKEPEEMLESMISKPSALKLCFYASNCLFFLLICYFYEYYFLSKYKISNIIGRSALLKYEIILYIIFYIGIVFFSYFCIFFYLRTIDEFEFTNNILAILIDKRRNSIASIISFFITVVFSSLYNMYVNRRIPLSGEKEGSVGGIINHLELEISENLTLISFGISLLLFLILVKSLVLEVINYRMYLNNYNERIKKNNSDISLLLILNRSTGKPMDGNIRRWATFLYKDLFPEAEGSVTFHKIENKFSKEVASKMYRLFKREVHQSISLEEFVEMYCKVIQEKNFLYLSLTQKKSLLLELNLILTILSTVLFIFILKHFTKQKFTVYTAFFDIQTILSLNFIFRSVISDAFNSIIYIFCIDTFDIGDKLKINNEFYEVIDLGLLYSTFIYNSYVTYIRNSTLKTYRITNYRRSEAIDQKYKFKFKTLEYLEHQKNLNNAIKKYIAQNDKNMSDFYKISKYCCEENQIIDIQVKVRFKLLNQNIRNLEEEEDKFKLFLHETIKEYGLESY